MMTLRPHLAHNTVLQLLLDTFPLLRRAFLPGTGSSSFKEHGFNFRVSDVESPVEDTSCSKYYLVQLSSAFSSSEGGNLVSELLIEITSDIHGCSERGVEMPLMQKTAADLIRYHYGKIITYFYYFQAVEVAEYQAITRHVEPVVTATGSRGWVLEHVISSRIEPAPSVVSVQGSRREK